MWKVIYIAPTQERAEKLKKLLGENGFLCQLKAVGTRRNGKAASIEISVPVSEAEEAYEVLAEHGFHALLPLKSQSLFRRRKRPMKCWRSMVFMRERTQPVVNSIIRWL